jgi:serine protease
MLIAAALAVFAYEAVQHNATFSKIPGVYIVVFKPALSHILDGHLSGLEGTDGRAISNYHIETSNMGTDFRAYHLVVEDELGSAMRYVRSRVGLEVAYIEQDSEVRQSGAPTCVTQSGADWGTARTSTKDLATNGEYTYDSGGAGEGVVAYVIDSGIYIENSDFGGRASFGSAHGPGSSTDLTGHGTHVASTLMGTKFGIAKKATAVSVSVLSSTGQGSVTSILSGITWSAADAKKHGKKSVGNLSLGGGLSKALNDAVNAAVTGGLPLFIAAGNSFTNACEESPGSATKAYTVMSTTSNDWISPFSNYGSCCQIAAPGSDILGAWIGGVDATETISGTSMASPQVAGVAAKLLSQNSSFTPLDLYAEITRLATIDIVQLLPAGSPNLLLYKGCDGSVTPTPPPAPTPAPVPTPVPPPPAPTPPPTPVEGSCSSVPPASRSPCGGDFIFTESDCKAAHGGRCCWSQEPITAIWCYDKEFV